MNTRDSQARQFIEDAYKELCEANAVSYMEDRDPDKGFLDGKWIKNLHIHENRIGIPQPVLEAHDFYNENCGNWGGAIIFKPEVEGRDTYVVYVTTDGDGGWVEVFDEDGISLGAARTYIELVSWGAVDEIRKYVFTGGYPAELSDRQTRTIWVKVVEAKAKSLK